MGGYAEQVVAVPGHSTPSPSPRLAVGEGVALLADGRTALALLRAAALRPATGS